MDNEQLLKRGICPKCYRPLYESKYTDKILCDCEITTQPMDNTDRLEEIRGKFDYEYISGGYFRKVGIPAGINADTLHGQEVVKYFNELLSETLEYGKQLGREEVIDEILSEAQYWENYYPQEFEKFIDTLTSLKEQKWKTRK